MSVEEYVKELETSLAAVRVEAHSLSVELDRLRGLVTKAKLERNQDIAVVNAITSRAAEMTKKYPVLEKVIFYITDGVSPRTCLEVEGGA